MSCCDKAPERLAVARLRLYIEVRIGVIAKIRGDIMIYINSKTRIRKIDDKNLQIEILRPVKKKGTKEERMEWMWDGYYTRLEDAFLAAFRKGLLESADEEYDARSVIEYIERAKLEIIRAIKSIDDGE